MRQLNCPEFCIFSGAEGKNVKSEGCVNPHEMTSIPLDLSSSAELFYSHPHYLKKTTSITNSLSPILLIAIDLVSIT